MSSRPRPEPIDLRSPAFKDDPRPLWRSLHAGPAVVITRQPLLGRVALAVHHAEAMEVLQDPGRFGVDARRVGRRTASGLAWWVPPMFRPLSENLLAREGNEHRELRARVDSAFHRRRLDALQPRIETIVDEALDELLRAADTDFVAHVARPVPQRVISELLGLDLNGAANGRHGSARHASLEGALAALSNVRGPLDLFRVVPAIRLIGTVMREEIERRRSEPRDDLLSELVASDGTGRPLSDDELLSMIFLLYVAGHETTTHLMSTSLLTLLREPTAREALETPLATGAVTELLRYLSPVQMAKPRFVTEELEIGGVRLRRGDTIAPLVGSANMDPRWIEDGYRLDLGRRAGRHLAFGAGPHVCLGLQLALRETRTVLDALFVRWPEIAICAPDATPAWTHRLGMRVLSTLPVTLVPGRRRSSATDGTPRGDARTVR